MGKKFGIVITTIGKGDFLARYAELVLKEELIHHCNIYVIADTKTPAELFSVCADFQRKGFRVWCPSLEEQDAFLKGLGHIHEIIPYNSDNRRNIGFLKALEEACEYIISIDDDNLPLPDAAYFREHAIVTDSGTESDVISSTTGWSTSNFK